MTTDYDQRSDDEGNDYFRWLRFLEMLHTMRHAPDIIQAFVEDILLFQLQKTAFTVDAASAASQLSLAR